MYEILCKNKILGTFRYKKNLFSEEYIWMDAPEGKAADIFGDIDLWIKSRHYVKHRKGLQALANSLQLPSTEALLRFTYGLSLSDCFWIRPAGASLTWDEINLYEHEFSELMVEPSKYLEDTVPDFTVDGSLEKCWIQRQGTSYLLKTGTLLSNGSYLDEPFAEQSASELCLALNYNSVMYRCLTYNTKLVSVCKNFTSPELFLLPISHFVTSSKFEDVVQFCIEHGFIDSLAEYLILDALIRNPDRHKGNIGVLMSTDSLDPVMLAPIFDNGLGFCSTFQNFDSYEDFEKSMNSRFPKLYASFDKTAAFFCKLPAFNKLGKISEFNFDESQPGFPLKRLEFMSKYVQDKAQELLEGVSK